MAKFYRTKAFKELEKEWKRKLKESGFDDIEEVQDDAPYWEDGKAVEPIIFTLIDQPFYH